MRRRLMSWLGYVQALEVRELEAEKQKLLDAVSASAAEVTDKSELILELQTSLTQCRIDLASSRLLQTKAEADSEMWKAKAESWESKFMAANTDAIKSREVTADFVSQLRFGRKIYDVSPTLPEKRPEDFQPITRQRVQARTVVQNAERQFEKELREYQEAQMKKQEQQLQYVDMGIGTSGE